MAVMKADDQSTPCPQYVQALGTKAYCSPYSAYPLVLLSQAAIERCADDSLHMRHVGANCHETICIVITLESKKGKGVYV